jgi:hypothetical protein
MTDDDKLATPHRWAPDFVPIPLRNPSDVVRRVNERANKLGGDVDSIRQRVRDELQECRVLFGLVR